MNLAKNKVPFYRRRLPGYNILLDWLQAPLQERKSGIPVERDADCITLYQHFISKVQGQKKWPCGSITQLQLR